MEFVGEKGASRTFLIKKTGKIEFDALKKGVSPRHSDSRLMTPPKSIEKRKNGIVMVLKNARIPVFRAGKKNSIFGLPENLDVFSDFAQNRLCPVPVGH